tara:strand:- start:168 stop:542 length:375 start_codon:yes stop_codon:yes gene_type:complete
MSLRENAVELPLFLRYTLLVVIGAATLPSCTGSKPQPIRTENFHDYLLTCNDISNEIVKLMNLTQTKTTEKNNVERRNLTAFIAGQILLVPLLGMDVTGSAKIERNAIFKRMQILQALAEKQEC